MEDQPENIVLTTDYWKVVVLSDQRYLGRCVVAILRPCGSLSDVSAEEFKDFHTIVIRMESALKKAFGAKMFNWGCLMNNAYQDEDPNPQVHWHFRPRYDRPVEFAGETFEDKSFGHHYHHFLKEGLNKQEVSEAVRHKIADAIRTHLAN